MQSVRDHIVLCRRETTNEWLSDNWGTKFILLKILVYYLLYIKVKFVKKKMSSEAFVTLATNDGYALGALVVA